MAAIIAEKLQFYNQERESSVQAYPLCYTSGMFYIVGLGNPGKEYADTPHNVGWVVLDRLQQKYLLDLDNFRYDGIKNAELSRGVLFGQDVTLLKPQTFMNNSGESLKKINQEDYKNVVVVYDDIDLPFGVVKLARSRGDGGHNGVKSVEQHLKTRDFIRVRVGVCPLDWFGNPRKPQGKNAVQNYLVKRKWSSWYQMRCKEIVDQVDSQLKNLLQEGYTKAVSKQK